MVFITLCRLFRGFSGFCSHQNMVKFQRERGKKDQHEWGMELYNGDMKYNI